MTVNWSSNVAGTKRATGALSSIRHTEDAYTSRGPWPSPRASGSDMGSMGRCMRPMTASSSACRMSMVPCRSVNWCCSISTIYTASSKRKSAKACCIRHDSVNARRARCSCHALIPAGACRFGSNDCVPPNCLTRPVHVRTSRYCWRPRANACRMCTTCRRCGES